MTPWLTNAAGCTALILLQVVAAVPWLFAVAGDDLRALAKRADFWLNAALAVVLASAGLTVLIIYRNDTAQLDIAGRVYASVLHGQLIADLFLLTAWLMRATWPKGATIALAAFRESTRQPMFWLLTLGTGAFFFVSMVIPYFSFGDDFKHMKQLAHDALMLATVLFAVLAASLTITEEIEGRTAVTLMSKPVTRRQFLLGKYFGILLAALAMTLILGWVLNWALYFKPYYDRLEDSFDPLAARFQGRIAPWFGGLGPTPELRGLFGGIGLWVGETVANTLAQMLGFGQVMVLLAVAATLAVRLPMVVSIVLCLAVFFLGNLAPILVQVSAELSQSSGGALGLVSFLAQLLDNLLPALEFFGTNQVFIRETYLSPRDFTYHVGGVIVYAVMYSAMVLLVGLILVEDRDLA